MDSNVFKTSFGSGKRTEKRPNVFEPQINYFYDLITKRANSKQVNWHRQVTNEDAILGVNIDVPASPSDLKHVVNMDSEEYSQGILNGLKKKIEKNYPNFKLMTDSGSSMVQNPYDNSQHMWHLGLAFQVDLEGKEK